MALIPPPSRKKPFENIVGKGENAGDKDFLPFHNVFYPFKENFHHLTLYHTLPTFNDPEKDGF